MNIFFKHCITVLQIILKKKEKRKVELFTESFFKSASIYIYIKYYCTIHWFKLLELNHSGSTLLFPVGIPPNIFHPLRSLETSRAEIPFLWLLSDAGVGTPDFFSQFTDCKDSVKMLCLGFPFNVISEYIWASKVRKWRYSVPHILLMLYEPLLPCWFLMAAEVAHLCYSFGPRSELLRDPQRRLSFLLLQLSTCSAALVCIVQNGFTFMCWQCSLGSVQKRSIFFSRGLSGDSLALQILQTPFRKPRVPSGEYSSKKSPIFPFLSHPSQTSDDL